VAQTANQDRVGNALKESHSSDDLDARVAESVRRALRLAGQAENGVERVNAEHPEEAEVS
jgi:hypothetical protein